MAVTFAEPQPCSELTGTGSAVEHEVNTRGVYVDGKLVGVLRGIAENLRNPRPTSYLYEGLGGKTWRESRLEEARARVEGGEY